MTTIAEDMKVRYKNGGPRYMVKIERTPDARLNFVQIFKAINCWR